MIKALLWDYDGTLANSNYKNYLVTLDLFKHEAPEVLDNMPENLKTQEAFDRTLTMYEDWRELYRDQYGLEDDEIQRLGSLWAKYQIESDIETELYPIIPEIIKEYSNIPQAIISQNGKENIQNTLKNYGLEDAFSAYVGIDEASAEFAKPHYYTFVETLKKLGVSPNEGKIIYVGDHEVDTQFVRHTQKYFNDIGVENDLVAIAVSYGGSFPETWKTKPDYIAKDTNELKILLNKLSEVL